ncbi:UNVERIFIED_CONTAM: YheC/D-like protein [Acetivibrio alkalicellulosi]
MTEITNGLFSPPVVGVFISKKQINLMRDQTPNYKIVELAQANKVAKTILYFFSIEDVNIVEKRIEGTYYDDQTGLWKVKTFPFPHVLYNRRSEGANNKKINLFKQELKKIGSKKINAIEDFNKWDVYKKLSTFENMKGYLPFTVIYEKPVDLLNMFKVSRSLFLKACTGRRSKRVIKINKEENGGYKISSFTEKLMVEKVSNFNLLVKKVNEFFCGQKFIIQKAIDILRIDDCVFDMLGEIQKNGKGDIEITGVVVRLGARFSPVTSIRTTGTIYKLSEFFKDILHYSDDMLLELESKVEKFLLTAYTCIERAYGDFGEMGIDFTLDVYGKLWFIECNSKSAKEAFYRSHGKDSIRKVFLNPLLYAKYINESHSRINTSMQKLKRYDKACMFFV